MSEDPNGEAERHEARIAGAITMVVGGLITGLCGACTLSIFISPGDEFDVRGIAAVIGGLPTLAGLFIFWRGLRRYRRAGG